MINNVNYSPNFGSTIISLKNNNKPVSYYTKPLEKYFDLVKICSTAEPQSISNKLKYHSQAALVLRPNEMVAIGKNNQTDSFIWKILKKIDPTVKFTDDIKPIDVDPPKIDIVL